MHDFAFVHDIRAVKADKGIDAERLRIVLKIIRRPPGYNKYIDAALLQLCNRLDRILRNFLLFINKRSVNVEKHGFIRHRMVFLLMSLFIYARSRL